MKVCVAVFLVCLLVAGTASAKPAESIPGITAAIPGASTGIYTQLAYTGCSDDSASVGTATGMGELDVDSIPDGASISIDGSPWTRKHCVGTWPTQTCFNMPVSTPFTGDVETGSHAITIALNGYKSYSGTVKICSQKVSYVHKDLALIATTPTTTVTATTTATTTTTAATTTSATAVTSVTISTVTSATGTTTTAAVPAITSPVSGATAAGTGSLSVTTIPAGAAVYIDGVQRGVSPAVIPGLAAGSHTVLLKRDGYQDLSTPVSITAGTINEFSTGLTPLPVAGTIVPATTTVTVPTAAATKAQTPGFETACGLSALGALLCLRKLSGS